MEGHPPPSPVTLLCVKQFVPSFYLYKNVVFQYDKLNELRTEFDLSCSSQDHLRQQLEPTALQDRLKVAALEAEEEAEAVAEKFLDGEYYVLID